MKCRCGMQFNNIRKLREHIAIQNPYWPRSHPDDQHGLDWLEINKRIQRDPRSLEQVGRELWSKQK